MTIAQEIANYDLQAKHFAKLPEYSVDCGTDYLAVKDAPHIIRKLASFNKILDLGCGTGLATRFLKKHFPGVTIIGADINQTMLEQAVHADPEGIYLHIKQFNDMIFSPFMKESFDVIVCSFVLHENTTLGHLCSFLEQIAMMLRPGGLFLAWDVSRHLFSGKWATVELLSFDPNIQDGAKYKLKLYPSNAEVVGTYWSPETIIKIMKDLSFQDCKIHYPLADPADNVTWCDEPFLAPYYVLEITK